MDLESKLKIVSQESRIPLTRVIIRYGLIFDYVKEREPGRSFEKYQDLAYNRLRVWAQAYGSEARK